LSLFFIAERLKKLTFSLINHMVKIRRKDGSIIDASVEELKKMKSDPELFNLLFEDKIEISEVKPGVKTSKVKPSGKRKKMGKILEEYRGKNVSVKELKERGIRNLASLYSLENAGVIKRVDWGVYEIPEDFSSDISSGIIRKLLAERFMDFYEKIKTKGKRIGEKKTYRTIYEVWEDEGGYLLFRIGIKSNVIRNMYRFSFSEVENPPSYSKEKDWMFRTLKEIINTASY